MYWSSDSSVRCGIIADAMSVNRFETIRRYLLFTDNSKHDEASSDKLWKLRPFLDHIQSRILTAVEPEEHQSIDEQMIPFTGKSSLKQYIKSKPKKWGYKVWMRSSVSGYMHEFEIYQGSNGNRPEKVLSVCADVVLRLSEKIKGKNHKLFFDNLFTTIDLLKYLRDNQIFSVGTLRKNRLMGAETALKPDKEMKARGDFCIATSADNITVVKWNDNNIVYTASTFAGADPVTSVERWDKKTKSYMDVRRPHSIEVYNKNMGGVDLSDFFLASYRHTLKQKRWYLRIFFHFVGVAIVNSWIIYRWQGNNDVDQLTFRSSLARCLINKGWNMINSTRGRPVNHIYNSNPPSRSNTRTKVPDEVRYNLTAGHWPIKSDAKNASRCISSICSSKTRYKCSACEKSLCPECFGYYHTQ
jgi:hypothetical protein